MRTSRTEREALIAEFWERGTLGIEERESPDGSVELEAYFDAPFPAAEISGAVEWRVPAEHDWSVDWREAWSPIEVGRRLFLVPFWSEAATPPGRLRVPIFPGRASGSGASTPTQLALEALEEHLRPGMRVADIGTGTGILAQTAAVLGAGFVVACDIDAEAAAIAKANLQHAFLGPRPTDGDESSVACGTDASVRAGPPGPAFDREPMPTRASAAVQGDRPTTKPSRLESLTSDRASAAVAVWAGSARSLAAGSVDLAVANLNAVQLSLQAREFRRILKPGGGLIAGGFPERHEQRVLRALGGSVVAMLAKDEWRCGVLRFE